MLILKILSDGKEMHGFAVANAIQQGSLYPALQRMLIKGWISGEWGRTEGNRRARYYRLTNAGRKQLIREIEAYRRSSGAIARILQPLEGTA
jgi:PadR family transcriptional regulator PadR